MNLKQFIMSKIGLILDCLIPSNKITKIRMGTIKGHKWIYGSSINACWLGIYEHSKAKKFAKLVHNGDVFFDIGAHVGYYTLLASKLVGEEGKVYAFEPFSRNIKLLKKHIFINNISNTKIFELALSNKIGQSFFTSNECNSMNHLSDTADPDSIEVYTSSLDHLFDEGKINKPSIMKIDVEGGEYEVLLGGKKILTKYHPIIFLATHERMNPSVHNKCLNFLIQLGYEAIPIDRKAVEVSSELLCRYIK